MGRVRALYVVRCADRAAAERLAAEIALEQTVEVPEELVSDEIRERVVGAVEAVEERSEGRGFAVTIGYEADLASGQLPQLLNLVYGNVSIKESVRLVDLSLTDELRSAFAGPRHGGEGLRALLGVYERPLLATALKPRGAPLRELARIAGEFARAGGDLVKDDHNLADSSLADFRERIARCQDAVDAANAETGRRCLYLPNLCAPAEHLGDSLECVVREGCGGVLVAPFVLGLDTVRHLAARHPLVVMAHPSLAGTFFQDRDHGIEPGLLLGKLFRLAGADVSIFPNFGGRFGLSRTECGSIAHHLRRPLGALRAALPAPAGGMRLDRIADMAEQYGHEAVFLIGGALLGHGESVRDSTAAFLDRIREHFAERLVEPEGEPASACEVPEQEGERRSHLPFAEGYRWRGRSPSDYKAEAGEMPFEKVVRQELLGRGRESMAFDLRYFEIGPGGYSSREKHAHTHAIIALRGKGVLEMGEKRIELKPYDVAYIPPLQVHQLRNEAETEPFGFFCIVDRVRDRPRKP